MSSCLGPCLRHCSCPVWVVWAAKAAVVYALACVGYLVLTSGMGTPLMDSLTPEQRALKRASVAQRGRAFAVALAVALLLVGPVSQVGWRIRP